MPGIFIRAGVAVGCVDGVCAPLFMSGMLISIFSGEAAGCGAVDEGVDEEPAGISMPGISIFSVDEVGFGDGEAVDDGICIPCISICMGDAPGCAEGGCAGIPAIFISIFRAGAFFSRGDRVRDEGGMFMPFMLIPLMPPLFCVCFLLATALFDLAFGLPPGLRPMVIPGIFCMSCCARAGRTAAPKPKPAIAMAQTRARKLILKLSMIPSRTVPVSGKL